MAEASVQHFLCPSCGKSYRFTPELVGKKVQCKGCGNKFQVPASPGQAGLPLPQPSPAAAASPPTASQNTLTPGNDGYELDLPAGEAAAAAPAAQPMVKHSGKCPQCGSKLKSEAVLCLNCGFNIAEGKLLQTSVGSAAGPADASAPSAAATVPLANTAFSEAASRVAKRLENRDDEVNEAKVDYLIPLSVLGAGLAMILLNAFVLYDPQILIARLAKISAAAAAWGGGVAFTPPSPTELRFHQLFRMAFTVLLQIPFLFIGLLVVARLFGTSFGYIVPAMLKILACAVAVNAVDYAVYFLLDRITDGFAFIGSMFSSSISLATFWALSSWLFDLEILEMFVLYVLTALLPIYAGVLLFGLLFSTLS